MSRKIVSVALPEDTQASIELSQMQRRKSQMLNAAMSHRLTLQAKSHMRRLRARRLNRGRKASGLAEIYAEQLDIGKVNI